MEEKIRHGRMKQVERLLSGSTTVLVSHVLALLAAESNVSVLLGAFLSPAANSYASLKSSQQQCADSSFMYCNT